jgi:casein kinase 1 delta/casein kinase I family protein HRR25
VHSHTLKVGTDDEKDARIKEMKESLSAEALCDGFLPGEFATYINYTRGLAFDDKPDYLYLRRLFYPRFRAEGFTYDHVFDWSEKLFKEMQSEANPPVPSDTEVTETPKGTMSKKGRRRRGRAASNPKW